MFIAAMQTVDIETRPQADVSSSRKPLAPHQENGALSVPLILTLAASNSVAILRPDWLKGSNQTAGPAKLLVCEQSIPSGCITERAVKLNSKFVRRSNFNSHQSLRLNS
jgi:hypothetical protein